MQRKLSGTMDKKITYKILLHKSFGRGHPEFWACGFSTFFLCNSEVASIEWFQLSCEVLNSTGVNCCKRNRRVGNAMTIHLLQDDEGLVDSEGSRKGGSAGERIACCNIELSSSKRYNRIWEDLEELLEDELESDEESSAST